MESRSEREGEDERVRGREEARKRDNLSCFRGHGRDAPPPPRAARAISCLFSAIPTCLHRGTRLHSLFILSSPLFPVFISASGPHRQQQENGRRWRCSLSLLSPPAYLRGFIPVGPASSVPCPPAAARCTSSPRVNMLYLHAHGHTLKCCLTRALFPPAMHFQSPSLFDSTLGEHL